MGSGPPARARERTVILSPEPERSAPRYRPAPGVSSLDRCVVGIIDNGKPGASVILARIGELLCEHGAARVRTWRKPLPSLPSPDVGEVGELADVVVAGVGDCGSCSLWSLRDALEAESRGCPAVTLVSEPFVEMVRLQGSSLGAHGPRIVEVPHPMATQPDRQLRACAEAVVERVIAGLKSSA
jgi:hypothetical protein